MKTKKDEVLEALAQVDAKENVRYNRLLPFLMNSEGVSRNQLNFLNRSGFTTGNLATVEFELKKLHKITDREVKNYGVEIPEQKELSFMDSFLLLLTKLEKSIAIKFLILAKYRVEIPGAELLEETSEEFKNYFSDETPMNEFLKIIPNDYDDLVPDDFHETLAIYLKENVNYPDKFLTEIEFLKIGQIELDQKLTESIQNGVFTLPPFSGNQDSNTRDQQEIRKVISEASAEVKTEIKFRDEFPFLTSDDCPQELKALVTDKFGHYHKFCEDHAELFDKVVRPYIEGKKAYETEEQITNDIIFGIAKSIVENFVGDQAIYDELLHYRETKTILGKHPIFKKEDLTANPFANLTPAKLAKKKSNLENYVRREANASEKAKNDEDKKKFSDKAKAFQSQLDAVNEILNAKQ